MTAEHRSPLPHIGGARNRWNTCPGRPARTVVTTTHEGPTGSGPRREAPWCSGVTVASRSGGVSRRRHLVPAAGRTQNGARDGQRPHSTRRTTPDVGCRVTDRTDLPFRSTGPRGGTTVTGRARPRRRRSRIPAARRRGPGTAAGRDGRRRVATTIRGPPRCLTRQRGDGSVRRRHRRRGAILSSLCSGGRREVSTRRPVNVLGHHCPPATGPEEADRGLDGPLLELWSDWRSCNFFIRVCVGDNGQFERARRAGISRPRLVPRRHDAR